MYRFLIVDDEEIIVNGLQEIFSNIKELDLDVYKAYSAAEAIEWLNRTRIDIVMTDIRMPEMDGLQLYDEILNKWPWCRVIFLTGHSEFDYVYKAIQHPSARYILKNEDHDKIINVVKDTIKELQQEVKADDLIQKANEQIKQAIEIIQNDYIFKLLKKTEGISVDREHFDMLKIHLEIGKPMIMALCQMESLPEKLTYKEKVQLVYSVRQLIVRYIAVKVNYLIVSEYDDLLLLFFQPREKLQESVYTSEMLEVEYKETQLFITGVFEVIQEVCKKQLGISLGFIMEESPVSWDNISRCYHGLYQGISNRVGKGIEQFDIDNYSEQADIAEINITTENKVSAQRELKELLYNRNPASITHFLLAGQKDKFRSELDTWLSLIEKIQDKDDCIALQAYYGVALALLSYINYQKLHDQVVKSFDINKLFSVEFFGNWHDAAEYLNEGYMYLLSIQEEEQEKRTNDAIAFIQEYVHAHIGEDLSLITLANKVHLNPSYLSRLYRQCTGSNLSSYIEDTRVFYAKKLLEAGKEKIQQVALKVGYDTAASFTRFFKKIEGVSPQEYRDIYVKVKLREECKEK